MKKVTAFSLNHLREIYIAITKNESIFTDDFRPIPDITGQDASDLIKKRLSDNSPCMIARFGSLELFCLCSIKYISMNKSTPFVKKAWDYIHGEIPQFWLEEHIQYMSTSPGFFPATIPNIEKFYALMLNDMKEVDILGSWVGGEDYFSAELRKCTKVKLTDIEPYYHTNPWSEVLEGKKILVIHPFKDSIEKQYRKRKLLFKDSRVLPEFTLKVFPAIQSIAGKKVPFSDWFEALAYMKEKIQDIDFDIAIIGCGAYGFPLAAHIKRMGKKSVHMGGATQLLFGIRGRRWEQEQFQYIKSLMNENWIRPNNLETPESSIEIEQGCYW